MHNIILILRTSIAAYMHAMNAFVWLGNYDRQSAAGATVTEYADHHTYEWILAEYIGVPKFKTIGASMLSAYLGIPKFKKIPTDGRIHAEYIGVCLYS